MPNAIPAHARPAVIRSLGKRYQGSEVVNPQEVLDGEYRQSFWAEFVGLQLLTTPFLGTPELCLFVNKGRDIIGVFLQECRLNGEAQCVENRAAVGD
jgi:hypothetical protein